MKSLAFKAVKIFGSRLYQNKAENLLDLLGTRLGHTTEDKKSVNATKEDIIRLERRLSDHKKSILKWLFIFWVSQGVLTVILLKLFK